VHLLWDYFNKGYEPLWYVRSKFVNLEKYLKPHHVIYLEDPFGKTEYEVTIDEEITRNIPSIIETVESIDDAYVIITSREVS
jgi:hypothetical protein